MNGTMHKLFATYTEMRGKGMESRTVLDKLREPITRLSAEERRELARYINALESGQIDSASARLPDAQRQRASRPIKRIDGARVTSTLLETSEIFFSYEYFGPDSVLVLSVRGTSDIDRNHHYQIRPQDTPHSLIFGRAGEVKAPDVDLQPHSADTRGVSRQHLALRYDGAHHNLTVTDLNSSNGSFINGQRLYHNESHVLRNGDELRLGRMVIDVVFRHLAPAPNASRVPVEAQIDETPEWLR
jgi:hypothetical protein